MTIFPGSIYGSMGRLGAARQGGATPWWLSGGIAAANCVAAYQPKGAADLAASYVNLANPGTYNAAPGVAPTWDAVSGWIFDKAKQQYLSTGINPAGTMQQYGLIVRYSELTVVSPQILLGQRLSTTDSICLFNDNNLFRAYSSGYGSVLLSTYLDGVLAVFANKFYYNGGEIGTINNFTGNALKSDVIYVGGRVTGQYLGAKIQCAAIYNAPISAAQVAALTAAMAAL